MNYSHPDKPLPEAAFVWRETIEERLGGVLLTISRIRSDGDGGEEDLLPYYEGARDALRQLLEPSDV